MTDPYFSKTRFFNLMRYTWTLLAVWTAILADLLTKEFALNTARAHLNKDTSFRFWGSMHGGVYVPTLEDIQPNPYLAHFPECGTSSSPPPVGT